jgi:hypothetical protein
MKRKLSLELAHVLVVDRLPVPLHISVKTLMEACEDEVVASDLCCAAAAAATAAAAGTAFRAEAFPRGFRSHEYWSGGGSSVHGGGHGGSGGGGSGGQVGVGSTVGGHGGTFCALSREEIIRVENVLMAHARGAGDRVYVARCARCGEDGPNGSPSSSSAVGLYKLHPVDP